MSNYQLILVIICYLVFIFIIAFIAEKKVNNKWIDNPYVYVLTLAVYCSAWTYYGSIGIASKSGISFLAIYLGPVIAIPLWIVLMRKIIRISKQQKISSIADFISMRYGNNRFLGAFVTITCLLAIIPYISLQLKAVSETFSIMVSGSSTHSSTYIIDDTTFYIALLISIFVAFFGTLSTDASKRRKGIIATVALESVFKLVFFLIIGIYVTYYLFDGTSDIYKQASVASNFKQLSSFGGLENGFNWLITICLSFCAIFLLPRQFHVAVVENENEKHLKKAIWLFPLYLLLFNVFVIFIAWAGNIRLPESVNNDYYSLLLPLQEKNIFFSSLVFMGGFSAVISMIVVSTLALSTMVSNNIIIPYGFLKKLVEGNPEDNAKSIKNIRRIAIFSLIIVAYFFYRTFSAQLSLYSIGLISFVITAQLAPSFFFGLFWRRGKARGANIGIAIGLVIIFYTLIMPIILDVINPGSTFINDGPFKVSWLKPSNLFGIHYLNPESNAFLWSIAFNTLSFTAFSLSAKGNYRERNYAEIFVNSAYYENLQENAFVWKGKAFVVDIKKLLYRFLGKQKTEKALQSFNKKHNILETEDKADARLINFSEKLLTGSIGSASAKILLSSVSKETPISLIEVLKILEETKKTKANNKLLKEKSEELSVMTNQLREVNEELLKLDKQKDEFLDTVAHELKTPVTSIKAASELLEDESMSYEYKKQFLQNISQDSDRLVVLINNILDLEKLSSNRTELDINNYNFNHTIDKAISGISHIANKKGTIIEFLKKDSLQAQYDEDRIIQVLTNLLSNSIKFVDKDNGFIRVKLDHNEKEIQVSVEDNGRGIPSTENKYIFDQFYQSKNQNIKKPQGSGIGLTICKKIIEGHNGKIWVDKTYSSGARLLFTIPK